MSLIVFMNLGPEKKTFQSGLLSKILSRVRYYANVDADTQNQLSFFIN